jgi:hypothetical protein
VRDDETELDTLTRTVHHADQITLECVTVTWQGPAERREEWTVVASVPVTTDASDLQAMRRRLLNQRRPIRRCTGCDTRYPVGDMHDTRLCHACASDQLGVVY